jgi:hypothetical protein
MFLAVKGNGLAAIAEIAKAYGISKSLATISLGVPLRTGLRFLA